jgi:predicted nucleic acid-binding protein
MNPTVKIFIDANLLFTAAYSPQGKAADVLRSSFVLVTSEYAAEEARRNIQAKRPSAVAELEKILTSIQIVASAQSETCPLDLPSKDQPIFLAALKFGATHLLTGDIKDFGPFMNRPNETCGIIIQTVTDFLGSLT